MNKEDELIYSYEELQDLVIKYQNIVINLQQKIDKVIEYIKECEYHLVIQPQKLLEILGDKE